jgi:pimeloyl-ACP methyl ester carboxylesterase
VDELCCCAGHSTASNWAARDLTAVLDEVGSEQAAIMAHFDASSMAMFSAGTRPERASALVLANASPTEE